jgi:hypothetical protein
MYLNQISSPPTVLLAIVPIIICAVNRGLFNPVLFYMSVVSPPHIVLEPFKRLPKKLYSSAAIVFVVSCLGTVASSSRSQIDIIKTFFGSSLDGKSVFQGFYAYKLSVIHATARFRMSTSEIGTRLLGAFSTLTQTLKNITTPFVSAGKRYYPQFTKRLSNQVKPAHPFSVKEQRTICK